MLALLLAAALAEESHGCTTQQALKSWQKADLQQRSLLLKQKHCRAIDPQWTVIKSDERRDHISLTVFRTGKGGTVQLWVVQRFGDD